LAEKQERTYKLQGPMGLGIDIQPNGIHVAFTAGTGVLVFVDLVAHLILRMLDIPELNKLIQKNTSSKPIIDLDQFRFELYTSAVSEEDVPGLVLINCLSKLCKKYNKINLF
jgi:hypothetical protein